jgi:hypothetical protein
MSALITLHTLLAGLDPSLWLAYAGVVLALVAAVLTSAALSASAAPHRVLLSLVLLACGAAAASTATVAGRWWPLVLTLHLCIAAVVAGYGLRYLRVNRPAR